MYPNSMTLCIGTEHTLHARVYLSSTCSSSLPQDEAARVVMYESQQWLPVASLFGLVGCPIPRELKAEVLESVQVRRGGRGAAGNGRQSGGQLGRQTDRQINMDRQTCRQTYRQMNRL